jgi:hypothetical protein
MPQLGNVSEIQAVKRQLDQLKERGLVRDWEIPYENILTRLTAAIFFLSPAGEEHLESIWEELGRRPMLHYRPNEEKQISRLGWRVEFNKGFQL